MHAQFWGIVRAHGDIYIYIYIYIARACARAQGIMIKNASLLWAIVRAQCDRGAIVIMIALSSGLWG